jgi:hypothetical protein
MKNVRRSQNPSRYPRAHSGWIEQKQSETLSDLAKVVNKRLTSDACYRPVVLLDDENKRQDSGMAMRLSIRLSDLSPVCILPVILENLFPLISTCHPLAHRTREFGPWR